MKADIKEWDPEDPKKWGQALSLDHGMDLHLLVDLRLLRLVSGALAGAAPQRRRFPS